MIIMMVILWLLFTQLSERGKEKTGRLAGLRSQDKKLKTTNKGLTEKVDGYEKGMANEPIDKQTNQTSFNGCSFVPSVVLIKTGDAERIVRGSDQGERPKNREAMSPPCQSVSCCCFNQKKSNKDNCPVPLLIFFAAGRKRLSFLMELPSRTEIILSSEAFSASRLEL